MDQTKLLQAEELYKDNPSDKNAIRYASHLISHGRFSEAEELLINVKEPQKKRMALIYQARIFRLKNNEKLFLETVSTLFESEFASEAYLETAEFYLSKMIRIKDALKNRRIAKNTTIEKEIADLLEKIRFNLVKSLQLKVNGNVLMRYGDVEYFEHNYEKAKYFYEKILSENHKVKYNDLYIIKLRLATIYLQFDELNLAYNLAIDLLNRFYQDNSHVYFLLAKIKIKQKDYELAKQYYQTGLENGFKPNDVLEYAKLCIEMLDYKEAEIYLGKLRNTYLENRALQELAKLSITLGKNDQAISYYTEMLNGNDKDKNIAYIGMGSVERLRKNYDVSILWLTKALNGNAMDKILAQIEIAKVYIDLENYSEAQELLVGAIRLSEGVYGRLEYAKLLVKLDQFEDAQSILNEIVSENKNEYDTNEAILELSLIERLKENYDIAKRYLNEFLIFPNSFYFKALCFLIDCNLDEQDINSASENIQRLKESQTIIDKERLQYYNEELTKIKKENGNTRKRARK